MPIRFLIVAADAGLPVSMNNVGNALRNGDGVEKNLRAAKEWLRLAMQADFDNAFWNLGLLYEEGIDGKPKLEPAESLLEEAVSRGVTDAQEDLDRVRKALAPIRKQKRGKAF